VAAAAVLTGADERTDAGGHDMAQRHTYLESAPDSLMMLLIPKQSWQNLGKNAHRICVFDQRRWRNRTGVFHLGVLFMSTDAHARQTAFRASIRRHRLRRQARLGAQPVQRVCHDTIPVAANHTIAPPTKIVNSVNHALYARISADATEILNPRPDRSAAPDTTGPSA